MTKIKLMIIGAGGHGRSVAEAAELNGGFDIIGFLDDSLSVGSSVLGYSVLGSFSYLLEYQASQNLSAIVAIGNNIVREELTTQIIDAGIKVATIIHPQAIVSPRASICSGSTVLAGAIIGTEAWLGIGTIVNCGAVVDHQARVEDFGHLGVNASMAGCSLLGRRALLQSGSSLGYGVSIPPGEMLSPNQAVERVGF